MPDMGLNLSSESVDALNDVNCHSEGAPNFYFFASLPVESVDTVDAVDRVSPHKQRVLKSDMRTCGCSG